MPMCVTVRNGNITQLFSQFMGIISLGIPMLPRALGISNCQKVLWQCGYDRFLSQEFPKI